jgi:hypothetical protein
LRDSEAKRQRVSGFRPGQGGASRFGLAATVAVVCVSLAVLAPTACSGGSSTSTAAVVDQLSEREPNPAFAETATATLEEAGYAVDYYPADEVTVDLYHELPTQDYDLIVLRAHSAIPREDLSLPSNVPEDVLQRIMDKIGDDVLLFTSEPYEEDAYPEEQKAMELFPIVYPGETWDKAHFAVGSDFIRSSPGQFDDSVVILMGCRSLASDRTAAAFVDRGASAVVGWTDTVSPSHTDAATEVLLRYLVSEELSVEEAVEKTMAEHGSDPWYEARMVVYPDDN